VQGRQLFGVPLMVTVPASLGAGGEAAAAAVSAALRTAMRPFANDGVDSDMYPPPPTPRIRWDHPSRQLGAERRATRTDETGFPN
jgi:hypothetical protein